MLYAGFIKLGEERDRSFEKQKADFIMRHCWTEDKVMLPLQFTHDELREGLPVSAKI